MSDTPVGATVIGTYRSTRATWPRRLALVLVVACLHGRAFDGDGRKNGR